MIARSLLLLVAAALAGCGARSTLTDPSIADAPMTCEPLSLDGPVVTVPEAVGVEALRPVIAPLAGGPESMLVFARHTGAAADTIAGLAFDPWGDWPPSLPEAHVVANAGGAAFAIAASDDPVYSILTAPLSSDDNCSLSRDVDAHESASLGEIQTWLLAGSPRFLAQRGFDVVGGIDGVYGPVLDGHFLTTAMLKGEGVWTSLATCGVGPLAGDAISHGAGFLAALATSPVNPSCALDGMDFPIGAPSVLRLATFLSASAYGPETTDIPLAETIDGIRLVPRGEGAWLFVQTRAQGTLEVRAVDAAGYDQGALATIASAAALGFSAAALGGGFVVAWRISKAALAVAAFDADGARLAQESVPVTGLVDGSIALLGAADGSAVVLGFSDRESGEKARVKVARLGCLSGG